MYGKIQTNIIISINNKFLCSKITNMSSNYKDDLLYVENLNLNSIAREFKTPTYVYSKQAIVNSFCEFKEAFSSYPHEICYAVKANSNIAILNILAKLNSGFDIVSGGELERVIAAGGDPHKIVFSGVGKTTEEIKLAIKHNIYCFNVESSAELARLDKIAKEENKTVNVSIRINPNIDPKSHPYISTGLKENKFGIEINEAISLYKKYSNSKNIKLEGIDCHIGSQIIESSPFLETVNKVLELYDLLTSFGIKINHLDIGGGLGVKYKDEDPISPKEFVRSIISAMGDRKIKLIIEPGRSIVANAGLLLTKVEYIKRNSSKNFCIVDAAMNDLLRPALYQAWQEIVPTKIKNIEEKVYDVVGPVCETGDFLGLERKFSIEQEDYLAILSSGAYGFCMSSNYNSRPMSAEVLIDGDKAHLIKERQTTKELFSNEHLIKE